MLNFNLLEKGLELVFPTHFVHGFCCLIAFTSRDIVQYVYCNCSGCDVIGFEMNLIFLIKRF